MVTDAFSVAGGSLGPGHAEPKGAGTVLLELTVEGWYRAGVATQTTAVHLRGALVEARAKERKRGRRWTS